MTTIELPVKTICLENEGLGIEEYEEGRALITVAHIMFVTEQIVLSDTTLITMTDGTDITILLNYSDVKELLKGCDG